MPSEMQGVLWNVDSYLAGYEIPFRCGTCGGIRKGLPSNCVVSQLNLAEPFHIRRSILVR
jgi:hypothetical protein